MEVINVKRAPRVLAFGFIAVLSLLGRGLAAPSAERVAVFQRLQTQIIVTRIAPDRSDIVSAGSVVELRKDGLLMYGVAAAAPPSNTYKDGKISQGLGGLGRNILISLIPTGNGPPGNFPSRNAVAGDTFWVTGISVEKDEVVFQLYSDPYDGIRYYADLKIPFPQKKIVPPVDDVVQMVAEVLEIRQEASPEGEQVPDATGMDDGSSPVVGDAGDDKPLSADDILNATSADSESQSPEPSGQAKPPGKHVGDDGVPSRKSAVPTQGKFVKKDSSDFIELKTGGACSFQLDGIPYVGKCKIQRRTLTAQGSNAASRTEATASFRVSADSLIGVKDRIVWERSAGFGDRGDAGDDEPLSAKEILTATSEEPGPQARGSSGQTHPPGERFTNDDVIRMVARRVDDEIVIHKIAKIRGTPQDRLDTSTDALIHLKDAGVSKIIIDFMLTGATAQTVAARNELGGTEEEPAKPGSRVERIVLLRTGEPIPLGIFQGLVTIKSVEVTVWPKPAKIQQAEGRPDQTAKVTVRFVYSNPDKMKWKCLYRVAIVDDKGKELGSGERMASLDKRQASDRNDVNVKMRALDFPKAAKLRVAVVAQPD